MNATTLLCTLVDATANIDDALREEDFDATPLKVEEDSDSTTYKFPNDRLGLIVRLGDVESVSDLGYDKKKGAFTAVVAKEGADTAHIMACLPEGCRRIASIRPSMTGQMFVSGDLLSQCTEDEKFAAGLRQLFATGFVPAEGVSFRNNSRSADIETIVYDMGTMQMRPIMVASTPVRFAAVVQGRLILATDHSVLLTKRVSATMMLAIAEGRTISALFLHDGSSAYLRSAPVTIVTNGASTIFGLEDGTNIAVRLQPDGEIKVDGTNDAYGALVSLFARISGIDTETAIALRGGRLTRVPTASLPAGFRRTAGIVVGNGHGHGRPN